MLQPLRKFLSLHAIYKLAVSFGICSACILLLLPVSANLLTRIMIGWDVFSFSYVALSWMAILLIPQEQLRTIARRQDAGSLFIFFFVVSASLASICAVLLLLRQSEHHPELGIETMLYFSGITCSWLLLHTIFSFRYAHLYYGDDDEEPQTHAGGLSIPGDELPGYLDFAYFSFVIGMTYQVSDISITSKKLRRLVLLHSMLAFVFNTVIVALTVNEIVNLR